MQKFIITVYYNKNFQSYNDEIYYKIIVKQTVTLTFRVNDYYWIISELLNANAEKVKDVYMSSVQNSSGATVNITKTGTYYLHLKADSNSSFFKDLYYTFTPTEEPTLKLAITMKNGETVQLGSITENYDGKVSWLSTKPSIASVTKGKVKALKKGQTTVRVSLDNGTYVEIKVRSL